MRIEVCTNEVGKNDIGVPTVLFDEIGRFLFIENKADAKNLDTFEAVVSI